jgi:AcrR family transcriptional regulator
VGTQPLVREPQQARSRQSFERALDAAVALLVERGSTSFTLVEVARVSGVSTGSMYGRIASKDDLIRVAHAREMERMDVEQARAFAGAPTGAPVEQTVRLAVTALAGHLERNATVLAPFMRLAHEDPVIAATGKASFEHMARLFDAALLAADGAPRGARGRRAAQWARTVAYAVLARQLGLGSPLEAAADHPLDQVIQELTGMIAVYLEDAAAR